MAVYMLDTGTSSYIMKRRYPSVLKRLERTPVRDVCLSAISKVELAFGVEISPRREQDAAALAEFLRYAQVLNFPGGAAGDYAEIRAILKQQGAMIGAHDLLIAAHARFLQLTVVTNNTREFGRVPGLRVENWVE